MGNRSWIPAADQGECVHVSICMHIVCVCVCLHACVQEATLEETKLRVGLGVKR
jgi:hypothetical protein